MFIRQVCNCVITLLITLVVVEVHAVKQNNKDLPGGFVYLSDVDGTIIQNLRYFTKYNFMGAPMIGYHANKAIMTEEAAIALSNAQKEFLKDGYSIVVYDAYRPQKTVDSFIAWAKKEDVCKDCRSLYYPDVEKSQLFTKGYIAERSGHTRGSTVDITIIKAVDRLFTIPIIENKELQNGTVMLFINDGTVNMGVHFDHLGAFAHHIYDKIPAQELQMRQYLRRTMENAGFNAYDQEWWHYTLKNEPFPDQYFNFDVK